MNEVEYGTQISIFDILKKPLPLFPEAAERIITGGYKAGWINKNVDTERADVLFVKPKNKYGYRSECPHFDGVWLSGGFKSLKCAICKTPIPGLHLDLTCSKEYMRCPFYNGESIENYNISEELL